ALVPIDELVDLGKRVQDALLLGRSRLGRGPYIEQWVGLCQDFVERRLGHGGQPCSVRIRSRFLARIHSSASASRRSIGLGAARLGSRPWVSLKLLMRGQRTTASSSVICMRRAVIAPWMRLRTSASTDFDMIS